MTPIQLQRRASAGGRLLVAVLVLGLLGSPGGVWASTLVGICPPGLQWQQSYGGTGFDVLSGVYPTTDGGFVLGGYSESTDEDRQAAPYGRYDFWVVRCDAGQEVVWEKSFGGTENDLLTSLAATSDGGFLLGGYSYSAASGSKTTPRFGPSNREDYWVVRISGTGEQLWDLSFGGSEADGLLGVIETSDGGFALGGYSSSGTNGNKTALNYGTNSVPTADYWLVRLDSVGNKLWDRSYGGSHHDVMTVVRETSDGGFILGGNSRSPADGTKTAPLENEGFQDFWVTKVDSEGNPVWDRAFGGSFNDLVLCMELLPDDGIYIGGQSGSPDDGTKSSPQYGGDDFWVLRLDPGGTLLWERSFGGLGEDALRGLAVTSDGGAVLAGDSRSVPGPGKSSPSHGGTDYWVVRLDVNGSVVWETSYGGLDTDSLQDVAITPDNGLLLGGFSASAPRGVKTAPALGQYDYWVIKLAAETPDDCDGDGVLNGIDQCPDTLPGEVVNADGCSIAQMCPCDSPWGSLSNYVDCVRQAAEMFRLGGLMDAEMEAAVISQAQSDICPPQPRFMVVFGLTNVLLGEVVVEEPISGSGIEVVEAGPQGSDGLSILLGESDSGVFIDPDAPIWGNYDPSWYLEETVYGLVDGVEGEVSRIRGRKTDYELYPVEVDFSALAPTGLTFQVFAGTTLLAQTSEAGAVGNVDVISSVTVGPRVNPFWRMRDGTIGALIDFNDIDPAGYERRFFRGPVGEVTGDRLFIRVDGSPRQVDFVSRADVVSGGDLRRYSFLDERVGMFGRSHRALGSSLFWPAGGRLHLTTPWIPFGTSSEVSGVIVDSMREPDMSVAFLPVFLTNELSAMRATISGQVAISGQVTEGSDQIGEVLFLNRTNALEMSVSFQQTDPAFETRIYRNGVLVGSYTSTNPPPLGWLGDGGIPAIVAVGYKLETSNSPPQVNATFAHVTRFQARDGSEYWGNQITVTPFDPQVVLGLASVALQLEGVESLTLVGAEGWSDSPALRIERREDLILLSWPIVNRPFVLERRPFAGGEIEVVTDDVPVVDGRNVLVVPLEEGGGVYYQLRLSDWESVGE